ncbi:unnamed protein product [Haemonchus placei]|uniref:Uncharacterized protein n=1 Tax=Haemonchus placei TaxID=6290 RepID=A0A0N4WBJ2_HAEPC|nr:unnamed protein product [Haemonchus placei]
MRVNVYSSSPSSSSGEDDYVPMETSPTKLLALAIQKRRALFGRKERDYRLELLQTGFIQSLCKHLGERRARRRKRGGKRSVRENKGVESSGTLVTRVEPIVQNSYDGEPPSKQSCRDEEKDPFGLDDFFVRVYGRSVTIEG